MPFLGGPRGPIPIFPYEGGVKSAVSPMAQFTTRVLLNGYPSADDYEKLHKAMKAKGFSRVIKSDDGEYYWMPNAEYDRHTTVARSQVLADAKAAANTVTKQHEILVTESNGRTWQGLKKATASDAKAA